MKKLDLYNCALAVSLLLGLGADAGAAVRQVAAGYEVSYEVNLDPGTSHGKDIQNVFIFEWDGNGNLSVDSGHSIAAQGRTVLKHTIAFKPNAAFVIGHGELADGRQHLYTLVNPNFPDGRVGVKFSQIFGRGERKTVALVQKAAAGSQAALDELAEFATKKSLDAPFDPAGGFAATEWTELSVLPEPTTLVLFGSGLLGVFLARRRRRDASRIRVNN